jgi:hypothetical protein
VYENRGSEKAFNQEDMIDAKTDTICIGKIPVMVNSSFCHLHGLTEKEAVARGHCSFDSGGYFIIKGSEKVRFNHPLLLFSGMCRCGPPMSAFNCFVDGVKVKRQELRFGNR